MFSIEYNLSQSYEIAKLRQEMLLREMKEARRAARMARPFEAELAAERRFRLMYRIRRLVHRMVPGLARVLF